jgi:hypothetical protein
MIKASNYGWGYLAFWSVSGLILGCLLPWFDGIWERASGQDSDKDVAVTEGNVGKTLRRDADWTLAVRGMGIFIGIAYAIVSLVSSPPPSSSYDYGRRARSRDILGVFPQLLTMHP